MGLIALSYNRLAREAPSVVKLVCRISVKKMVSIIIAHRLGEAEEEGDKLVL